jgi:hypothetical protein
MYTARRGAKERERSEIFGVELWKKGERLAKQLLRAQLLCLSTRQPIIKLQDGSIGYIATFWAWAQLRGRATLPVTDGFG